MSSKFVIILAISLALCTCQQFPLIQSQYGYYTLNFTGSAFSGSYNPFPLLIDITSTGSYIIAGSLLGFSTFSISSTQCTVDNTIGDWPYFSISIIEVCESSPLSVSMDDFSDLNGFSTDWVFIYSGGAYTATIASNFNPEYGQGTYGSFGFGYGYGSNGKVGFFNGAYSMMAIYLNKTTGNGFLTVGTPNLTYATAATPLFSLPVVREQLSGFGNGPINSLKYGNILISDSIAQMMGSQLIFDLHCPGICFPQLLYQTLFSNLPNSEFITSCQQGTIPLECTFESGNVLSLPNLYVIIGDQVVPIPPQVYVQNYQEHLQNDTNNTLTLNFYNISSNPSSWSPAIENSQSNVTVFGSAVMSYYYTVFNLPNNTTDLYLAVETFSNSNSTPNNPDKASPVVWIAPVAVICLLIVCYLLYKRYKRRKRSENNHSPFDLDSHQHSAGSIRNPINPNSFAPGA